MFCDNCGHQNPDSAKFCSGCGRGMDGAMPDPMKLASDVSNRLRGVVASNDLLVVDMIGFYLGFFSAGALVGGMLLNYISLAASRAAASPVGALLGGSDVGSELKWYGALGLFVSLFGAYGLACARGLFGRRSWARNPARIAAFTWSVICALSLFAVDNFSGGYLLLVILQIGVWCAVASSLSMPSLKGIFEVE